MSNLQAPDADAESEIEINPKKCGGIPVLRGTRMPIGTILSLVADGDCLQNIAKSFDLVHDQLKNLFHSMAGEMNFSSSVSSVSSVSSCDGLTTFEIKFNPDPPDWFVWKILKELESKHINWNDIMLHSIAREMKTP